MSGASWPRRYPNPYALSRVRHHGDPRLRGRLRRLDAGDRLVGRAHRRGRCPTAPPRPRARHHALRHRRHVRRGPRRDAPARRVRRVRRRRHRDEVRLRHLLALGAQGARRAPARLDADVRPLRARAQPGAPRPRDDRPLPAAQPAAGRAAVRRALRAARRVRARGQDPRATAWRSARRSAGATRASGRCATATSACLQIIHNALEQEPGRELLDVARGARRHRRDGARAALVGDARGQVHEGHGLPRERPSPPPQAGVADGGAAEDRAPRLPDRVGRARRSGRPRSSGCWRTSW